MMLISRVALAFVLRIALVPLSSTLPAQSISNTEYTVQSGAVTDIIVGPDVSLWFINPNAAKIGRITTSGVITEYPVPNSFVGITCITAGPDGAIWFGSGPVGGPGRIGRITPAGVITEFSSPAVNAITSGPDGALWFTESSYTRIGRMTTSGVITEYPVPNARSSEGGPYIHDITVGVDRALWFTDNWNGAIGRITTSGAMTEYTVPGAHPRVDPPQPGPTVGNHLNKITAGPDGALWFTRLVSDFPRRSIIGRITPAGVITEYAVDATVPPVGITTGPDGALWFTLDSSGTIGRITTAGAITQYSVSPSGRPYSITTGPDGALWVTHGSNTIGRSLVQASTGGVLPHIAAGGGWTTVITLVNTASVPISVNVGLHNANGGALSLPVMTTQHGATQTTTTASVSATIDPNATLLINIGSGLAATVVGWADVVTSGSVNGYAIFRSTSQTGATSEGTVLLVPHHRGRIPSSPVILPYDNSAGFVTGVAIANLSTASA
jgi:virginiamycin B lyase